MKNFHLSYIPFIFLTLIIATSCVSKRKYLETDSARVNALRKADTLSQEVSALKGGIVDLKKEFNSMQNELRLSNARKDAYIDSLSKKAVGLSTVISKKDESLSDQVSVYQTEKQHLSSTIAQNQSTINELTGKIKEQENVIAQIRQETSSLKFDLANQKEAAESKTSAIKSLEEQISKLEAETNKHKKEIASLKKQITAKDSEIEKLTNNVKLLKNQ